MSEIIRIVLVLALLVVAYWQKRPFFYIVCGLAAFAAGLHWAGTYTIEGGAVMLVGAFTMLLSIL